MTRIKKFRASMLCQDCGESLLNADDEEPQHVFCDLCNGHEHPADLTTDWNGETGNHLSCEALVAI